MQMTTPARHPVNATFKQWCKIISFLRHKFILCFHRKYIKTANAWRIEIFFFCSSHMLTLFITEDQLQPGHFNAEVTRIEKEWIILIICFARLHMSIFSSIITNSYALLCFRMNYFQGSLSLSGLVVRAAQIRARLVWLESAKCRSRRRWRPDPGGNIHTKLKYVRRALK